MKRYSPSSHKHNAPIRSGLKHLSRLSPYKKSSRHFSFPKRRMRQSPSAGSRAPYLLLELRAPSPTSSSQHPRPLRPCRPSFPAGPPAELQLLRGASRDTRCLLTSSPGQLGVCGALLPGRFFSAALLKHPNLPPAHHKARRRPPQRTQLGARHQHLWS